LEVAGVAVLELVVTGTLRVIAEEMEHGEMKPAADMLRFSIAA
jgi:hypothetical protein